MSTLRLPRIPALHFAAAVLAAALAGELADSRALAVDSENARVDFARDVRPILSDNCFLCHGPADDSREADLRLDDPESATMDRGDYAAIVPGDAAASEVIRRITSADPDEQMPPPDSDKSLSPEQIDVLRRWVEQGAEWSMHWAFIPPERPAVPPTPADAPAHWKQNPIDAFVLRRIRQAGLKPSPEASRETLLRRLHLDLTGLPPTLEEQRAFLEDPSSDAYQNVVERLLASPHYGERWGRHWLDAARYSDSDGYEKDLRRTNWHYRDWVVRAVNDDKPYDRFIIEQVAGDLLPEAGQDEIVATGFLRNSMVNEEGGADPEQFRVEGIFDRMDAIGKAVLGLTTQCAQCHTHKYDPLTHADYFGMFAYLNNCNESIVAAYTAEEQHQIDSILQQIADREAALKQSLPTWREELASWAAANRKPPTEWRVVRVVREDYTGEKFAHLDDGSILSQSFAPPSATNGFILERPEGKISAVRLELLTHPDLPRGGPGRSVYGTNALTEFIVAGVDPQGAEKKLKIASATADINVEARPLGEPFIDERKGPEKRVVGPIEYAIDGDGKTAWTTQARLADRNQPRKAVFCLEQPIDGAEFSKLIFRMNQSHGGPLGNQRHSNIAGRFRFSVTDDPDAQADPLPAAVREIVSRDVDSWDDGDWDRAFAYWRTTRDQWSAMNAEIDQLLAGYPAGASQYVVSERQGSDRRTTYRMERGNFLSPAEPVEPHTPDFLHPVADDAPANRLTFARWLVDRQSPTTARALVNRVWQTYFGIGFVETAEDLGSQAPPASHPQLLDWLAVELMDSQWSLKHLHRLIVNSATYRQSSTADPSRRAADPYNRLLARGPRVRVEAEIVRDIALAASGLLNRELGGPCVFPPAPEFLFLPPASYGEKEWFAGDGPDNYRRSLYVQAYRSAPYPTMQVFDAPGGDASCTRRTRSNTPLQALTLLNEPQLVSCARGLARRLVASDAATDRERIELAFRLLLSRTPTEDEITTVARFLETCRAQIASGDVVADAIAPIEEGASPGQAEEFAVWTLTSRSLLNLDETITKQ